MADDETPDEAVSGEADRLAAVEDKLDRLAAAVARLVPGSHREAEQRTEDRLDRPSTVEEQVRAELAKRDRQAAEQKAADEAKSERESIREQLAKLQETAPAPPERRATRFMWGATR